MDIVGKIIDLLQNHPDDFYLWDSDCRLIHRPSGIAIWVASGRPFYRVERPQMVIFSFWERRRFHKVYRPWLERRSDNQQENSRARVASLLEVH